MADTAFLRKKLSVRIQFLQHQLDEAQRQLAAVEAVEDLERELREEAMAGTPTVPDASWRTVDLAAHVLADLGGEAHGKAILEGVVKHKTLGGDHQMEAVGAAMSRDDRFEKVEGKRNYWRLKQALKAEGRPRG